ncbi:MAG: cytochrome c oxidase subunit II [Armatimonadota bacterium]|nr:cytochrome c oxidase subunit II [Armatimonadota bacterium]MDR7451514.1 cytochrome c oxidase subunit II [Armatimonadota bacterium]MDR7467481.1 cytochrome c oxidase subunit II [Armatimonadota bacterium]MDR7494355.1 cytochrome c oxidase subunit II [Armatimonadota bacterium]MDR7499172.1 cytochrome c oxidase subunit II [Armatimonadota bacterium]
MRRHLAAALLWAALTAAGLWAARVDLLPLAAAREAAIIDEAFRLLLRLSVPVFAFVLAVLIYSLVRFRVRGEPREEGPPLFGRGIVPWVWLGVTSALAVYVIFNPGLRGLAELRANPTADLVVQVEGSRWQWKISYPQYDMTVREVVLPVGRRVRFDVTATDVLHSFWIPAFRVKIDAVPGMTTRVFVTPTVAGSYEDSYHLRLQCAELCGLGHNLMASPVRVVDAGGFEAWVARGKSR